MGNVNREAAMVAASPTFKEIGYEPTPDQTSAPSLLDAAEAVVRQIENLWREKASVNDGERFYLE